MARIDELFSDYAIFAKSRLLMSGCPIVESKGSLTKIGTNSKKDGALSLHGASRVDVDVEVGPRGKPKFVIQGIERAKREKRTLPKVVILPKKAIPTGLVSLPKIEIKRGESIYMDGKKYCPQVTIRGRLAIQNDLILVTELFQVTGGQILVEKDATFILIIYSRAIIHGALVNRNEDPAICSIYGLKSCSEILIDTTGKTYARIYAPDARVHLAHCKLYGSIIGDEVRLLGTSKVTHMEAG